MIRRTYGGWWEVVAAGTAPVIGLILRLDQYRSVPFRAPNPDEWNWAWAGLSQLLGMPPTAWTLFWKAYPQAVWVAPPAPYTEPLVHPWVDAPPLFGWLVGVMAVLVGSVWVMLAWPERTLPPVGVALAAETMAIDTPDQAVARSICLSAVEARSCRLMPVRGAAMRALVTTKGTSRRNSGVIMCFLCLHLN